MNQPAETPISPEIPRRPDGVFASRAPFRLAPLGPVEQLRAGRLGRRVPQLLIGLFLFGFSMAMLIEADLGLDPWDVLHQGLTRYVPLSFGTVTILVSAVVLLLWIPLRQKPGLGTICNVFVVGLSADFGLWLLPTPDQWAVRIPLMIFAVVLNGVAGAVYIGSQLGPGPRDGLMTGLVWRTGGSLRLIRTGIEAVVLVVGFVLGGTVGPGTVLYAVTIGPLVQFFLPWFGVLLDPVAAEPVDDPGSTRSDEGCAQPR